MVGRISDSAGRSLRPNIARSANRTIILVINLHDLQTLFRRKFVYYEMGNQTQFKPGNNCQKYQFRKNYCFIENHTKKKHPLYYSSNRLLTIVSILGRASGKNRNKVTLFESKLPHKRLITTYLPCSTISKLTTILKMLYSSWSKFTQTNDIW